MNEYNELLSKEISKFGDSLTHNNSMKNITPNTEWIKWLSYESEFEKERTKYFESKNISELTYEEMQEITRYKEYKYYAHLFQIYGTENCTEEEFMKVYNFMHNKSLEKLMLRKLTSQELIFAKEEIKKLKEIPEYELKQKIDEEQKENNYAKLSMVESFILYEITSVDFARTIDEIYKRIDRQLEKNSYLNSLIESTNISTRK